jgi:hypothetical protein
VFSYQDGVQLADAFVVFRCWDVTNRSSSIGEASDCMAQALTPPFPNASTISAFKGRVLVSLTAHCAAVVIMGRRRRRRNDSINGSNTDAVDAPLRGCYPPSGGVKASESAMSRDLLPGLCNLLTQYRTCGRFNIICLQLPASRSPGDCRLSIRSDGESRASC